MTPRFHVPYYCASRHRTRPAFAADAVIPGSQDCPRCGLPANTDTESSPLSPKITPYKIHLTYVKGRRTDTETVQILEEVVSSLGACRAAGEILY